MKNLYIILIFFNPCILIGKVLPPDYSAIEIACYLSSYLKDSFRKLERTWTLLSKNADEGASEISLKHDANWMNWRVGDTVGIATTNRGDSTLHKITYINVGDKKNKKKIKI